MEIGLKLPLFPLFVFACFLKERNPLPLSKMNNEP